MRIVDALPGHRRRQDRQAPAARARAGIRAAAGEVWWRPERGAGYERFTEEAAADLAEPFRQHGRTALLPPARRQTAPPPCRTTYQAPASDFPHQQLGGKTARDADFRCQRERGACTIVRTMGGGEVDDRRPWPGRWGRPRTHRFGSALGGVALVALGIRIAFIVVVAPQVPALGDASAYHLLAEQPRARAAATSGRSTTCCSTSDARPRSTRRCSPRCSRCPARLGAHSVEQQRIFLAFVGAGTVVLVGLLGRRVASPAVGLIAAALAAVYPMLFLSEATLMAESLYVALVTLLLLCAYRAYDDPKPARFVALGVAIGFATLDPRRGLPPRPGGRDPARRSCCAISTRGRRRDGSRSRSASRSP